MRVEEEAQRENEDTSAAVDSSAEVDSAAEEQEESFAEHQYNLSEIPANLEYNARQLLNQLMMRDILIGRNFYPHAADDRQTQVNIDIWPCAMCVTLTITCGQDPAHWQPSSC